MNHKIVQSSWGNDCDDSTYNIEFSKLPDFYSQYVYVVNQTAVEWDLLKKLYLNTSIYVVSGPKMICMD